MKFFVSHFYSSVGRVIPGLPATMVLLGALLLGGCQTYQEQSAPLAQAQQRGDIEAQIKETTRMAERSAGGKDALVWRLENAAVLRTGALRADAPASAAKLFQQSQDAFAQADGLIEKYEAEAKVRVGQQTLSLLTNQATLPYRGSASDKIMVSTYRALNYAALGDWDATRVELNRVYVRQQEAVRENARRIEEAQAEAREAKARGAEINGAATAYDASAALADPRTKAGVNQALAETRAVLAQRAYEPYVNPFSVFLDGLFFLYRGENRADWERALKSWERVERFAPRNSATAADVAAARARAQDGSAPSGITYVVFETGGAPVRVETRIDIPLFIASRNLSYVGIALPELRYRSDYFAELSAASATTGQSVTTQLVADMDAVVAQEFTDAWPAILTKTIVTSGLKAVAQHRIEQKMEENLSPAAQLLGKLIVSGVNAGTTIADTRSWTSLPKQFQYARLRTPADGRIQLTVGAGSAGTATSVTVDPTRVNVVYVKSTNRSAPLRISTFSL